MDNQSLSHVRWKSQYHIVFIPKYRKKILYGKLKNDVREIISILCKYKEMLSNNQELTGAYKDFYEHELTESMLMKQGYGYNDSHNMALEIHNVQPQALYSPEIVQEFSKWFNKSDYEYWGITIKK